MKERGQAVLILVFFLAIAGVSVFYTFFSPWRGRSEAENKTTNAMSVAKDALIGFATSSATRPGQLPCPDTNNDGLAEPLDGSNNCPKDSAGNPIQIGRLPWKTLGLEDLRDDSGERLWYAVTPVFTNLALNEFDTDTKGALTVNLFQGGATTTITNQAVALIFAPGAILPGQNRTPLTTASCPTNNNDNVLVTNCAANYLESAGVTNNAAPPGTGPFVTAQPGDTFNDRSIMIDTAALWTVVERRVAREMLALLRAYRQATRASGCNCYPWASNNFDDDSVDGRTRGMVPMEDALPVDWGSGGTPSVPSWMIGNNKWGRLFYYAVAPSETEDHNSGDLELDNPANKKAIVLITTGPAGASRPSTTLSDYLEDSENRDNDDQFVTPSSTTYARDRIYSCPLTPALPAPMPLCN